MPRYTLRTLPQFSLSGVMWAVLWLGVSLAVWRLPFGWHGIPGIHGIALDILQMCLIFVPITTAIGALFSHAVRGAVIGSALFMCWVAWGIFALSLWGGT